MAFTLLISVLLIMMMEMTIDTTVEIKHTMLSSLCGMSLDLFVLFSCVSEETVSSVAVTFQERLPFFIIFLINSCCFYSRAASI